MKYRGCLSLVMTAFALLLVACSSTAEEAPPAQEEPAENEAEPAAEPIAKLAEYETDYGQGIGDVLP